MYRKEISCPIIGITGSNGKTTTKNILSNILSSTYKLEHSSTKYLEIGKRKKAVGHTSQYHS